MSTVLLIGGAGFLGAVSRYWVSGLASRVAETFPWGTFVVNASGSLLLGFLVGLFGHTTSVSSDVRVAITVGFIGAYTTFSTFALETFEFIEVGDHASAAWNVVVSVVVGVAFVALGLRVGSAL